MSTSTASDTPEAATADSPVGDGLSLVIPFADGHHVYIGGRKPWSEADWSYLLGVLAAMKPGLVSHEVPAVSTLDEGQPGPRRGGESQRLKPQTSVSPCNNDSTVSHSPSEAATVRALEGDD